MATIPTEMRRLIAEDCKKGISQRKVALKWGVCPATVTNIMTRYRETGEVTPPPRPNRRVSKIEHRRDEIIAFLEKNKNATLNDVRKLLNNEVCLMTVWLQLQKWGFSHKKNDFRKRA
jgi:transposase